MFWIHMWYSAIFFLYQFISHHFENYDETYINATQWSSLVGLEPLSYPHVSHQLHHCAMYTVITIYPGEPSYMAKFCTTKFYS